MDYLITTPAQLGMALKIARKQKKLTQVAAGAKVGLLPKTISALEHNPEACSILSLIKLLSALDLELTLADKAMHRQSPEGGSGEGW